MPHKKTEGCHRKNFLTNGVGAVDLTGCDMDVQWESGRTKLMGKFYYHITDQNLGDEVTLLPNPGPELEFIKRISVSDCEYRCMIAIELKRNKRYYIYRTKRRQKARNTGDAIWDGHWTREKWLLNPTKFVLVRSFRTKKYYIPEKGKHRAMLAYVKTHYGLQ